MWAEAQKVEDTWKMPERTWEYHHKKEMVVVRGQEGLIGCLLGCARGLGVLDILGKWEPFCP